ncbi:MAG: FtsX-like permease family protein, partial [Salinibacterium sp.]|nr:FtsX-like permease family protein [Salinibacterium sp.]
EVALSTAPQPLREGATAEEVDLYNDQLGVRIGDEVEFMRYTGPATAFDRVGVDLSNALGLLDRFRKSKVLRVVGIAAQPPMGGRPQALMTRAGLDSMLGTQGEISAIDLKLVDPQLAPQFVVDRAEDVPPSVVLKETARTTSGVEKNLASSQLGLILATVLSFLIASFINLTGLNTEAAERERELAMLRCIGASKGQLGVSQLMIGGCIGLAGAVLGLPLGLAIAWLGVTLFPQYLPAGMGVPVLGSILTVIGAIGSGLIGAAFPAWRASRSSPLDALGARARPRQARGLVAMLIVGLLLLALHAAIIFLPSEGLTVFWGYATIGLPAMFLGYFILGTPTVYALARVAGPGVSRLLALPPKVLERTIISSPARYGLTAGAMMAGLALMVSIWTQGGAVLRDWLDKLRFADAFVSGISLPPESQDAIESLDFVTQTCAITIQPVQTDAFGIKGLSEYATALIAFEPRDFFDMSTLEFVQGDQETAIEELEKGNALPVAKEFLLAQNLGVGDSFVLVPTGVDMETLDDAERASRTFRIVGVVRSPGLEIVSKFFNVGEDYLQQSMHAVFGTRADLERLFSNDSIQLIQIELSDDIDDAEAIDRIRALLASRGVGILDTGSGRRILGNIETFIRGSLKAFTVIALVSMLIASLGVANVIVSSIQSRQFEFGVLRAVGAQRGLVLRLVAGEAVVIGLAACVLGVLMGLEGAMSGQRLNTLLFGLDMKIVPPLLPIAIGCLFVMGICLLAAAPAIARLNTRKPRELLAAMKG